MRYLLSFWEIHRADLVVRRPLWINMLLYNLLQNWIS